MSRNEVPDEEKDGHNDMLGDRDDIRASDFKDLNTLLHCSIEINVIGANTSRDTDLQVLCLKK